MRQHGRDHGAVAHQGADPAVLELWRYQFADQYGRGGHIDEHRSARWPSLNPPWPGGRYTWWWPVAVPVATFIRESPWPLSLPAAMPKAAFFLWARDAPWRKRPWRGLDFPNGPSPSRASRGGGCGPNWVRP
ncbi:hypothetical protein DESC_480098 [Desulfosarcina cetonica]|nr:hypothetical protein DESC_480098 [Desulfosarcina cetonica]